MINTLFPMGTTPWMAEFVRSRIPEPRGLARSHPLPLGGEGWGEGDKKENRQTHNHPPTAMKSVMPSRLTIFFLFPLLALAACADWVPLKPGAEGVRVATADQVKHCRHVGRTIVSVADTVAGIRRDAKTVAAELERLARNHAPKLDGDTIVPDGPVRDGERTYKVYRCRGR